jgi:tRNA A64-2'-O-ribosylphosphate transferase
LTPQLFWEHHHDLITADRFQLSGLLCKIIISARRESSKTTNSITPINRVGGRLLIGSIDDVDDVTNLNREDNMDSIILASSMQDKLKSESQKIYIPVVAGKRGQSHFLQITLPTATTFIRDSLAEGRRICIACESGKDLSVGVALAALQLFFQDNGHLVPLNPDSTSSQGAFYFDLPATPWSYLYRSRQEIHSHQIRVDYCQQAAS